VGDGVYRQRAYELMDGDVLGELALFGHRRSARVRALEDVTLLAIPCAEFKELLRELPRIGYYTMSNLSKILAERLVMANISMQDMMTRQGSG
jgi:CRP-like cAMP-binding protein